MQQEDKDLRILLARKHYGKDEMLGEIIPIFEIDNNVLSPLTEYNFCPTMKVFIKSNYEEIDKRFSENEIFKITVTISDREPLNTDTGRLHCKYVASGRDADRVKAKDYIQIVQHPLPDPANRTVFLDNYLPGTQYIFIEDEEYLYGPFKWVTLKDDDVDKEIKIEFVDSQLPNVRLSPYQIYKINLNNHDIEESVTISSRANVKMISDLRMLNFREAVIYEDYASDDEVMRFCAKVASDFNSKLIDKKQADMLVATLNKNPKIKGDLFKNRLARFVEIAGEIHEVKQDVAEALVGFFNTESGRRTIHQYVEDNEEVYLAKIRKAKEKDIDEQLALRKAEIVEISDRINELNETKSNLNLEVEKKREAANSDEYLQSAYRESDKLIQEKRKEIEQIEAYIEEKKPYVKGFKKIEDLTNEVKVLELFNQRLKDKGDQLREEIRTLKNECEGTEDELRKKLNNMRPYVDHITGGFIESPYSERNVQVPTVSAPTAESVVERQKLIIDYTQKEMHQRGRYLEDWQVANLLISTQQSFITFMAGLPGVGKTSLARMIIDVQGLKARSQEISVARGWTGEKDLIGYYNPLASRFQPSSTGLYNFLRSLSNEADSSSSAMAYVLLDEANLSPIEHYWSSFMGMSDSIDSRELTLGDDAVHITNNLRFICTINYDGTTEPLSQRIVDRAPVIVLDPEELFLGEEALDRKINESVLPLNGPQMDFLFGLDTKVPDFEDDERTVYEKIKTILVETSGSSGRPISISPRKEIAIRQFCGKARAVMREYQDLRALDVAILQHVLPLIRGNGPSFAKRIEKLKSELERADLPLSKNYVSRILSLGEEDLHSYDFFCW